MELSLFLAKVIGLFMVVLGLSMMMNKMHFQKAVMEIFNNAGTLMLLSLITLVLGTLLVLSHNVWVKDWPIIITIIAWLVFIKGIMRLMFPEQVKEWAKVVKKDGTYRLITATALILGAYLCYLGFAAY